MSGWLDIFEDDIKCPHCNNVLKTLFIEDGGSNREPVVITTIAQDSITCFNCWGTVTYSPQHSN